MKVNMTLFIPAYKRYENIYNLLKHLESNNITFNNIVIMQDKIEDKVEASVILYKAKIKNEFSYVTNIVLSQHKGIVGVLRSHDYLNDDENYIWLEDDLWLDVPFFNQAQDFFDKHYSESTPIFIGYSKTGNTNYSWFKTYMYIPMWAIVTKGKHLKELVEFYRGIVEGTPEQRLNLADSILQYKFDCSVFEKYKETILKVNRESFTIKLHNIDYYFMIYLLSKRICAIKNTKCYVSLREPRFATNNMREVVVSEKFSDAENDMISGITMWD